ncbi:anti-sigma factor family protein [Lignipirellula cremea]|nr:hypothetical protein [Lignipirellula cremea]
MNDFDHPTEPELVAAELTAYLDGELGEHDRLRVEQRLISDESYRGELQRHQQVWDALDSLPKATADAKFAQTTIEIVAQSAAVDEATQQKTVKTARWYWLAAAAVCTLFCFSLGYLAITAVASRENNRLVRDLPMLENLDGYEQVDSLEFLELLEQSGLFSGETSSDI